MKKLLSSLMVACLMFVATISTVGAVGSITADEQKNHRCFRSWCYS